MASPVVYSIVVDPEIDNWLQFEITAQNDNYIVGKGNVTAKDNNGLAGTIVTLYNDMGYTLPITINKQQVFATGYAETETN